MKLNVGFVAREDRAVPYLFVAVWVALLGILIISAWLVLSRFALVADNVAKTEQHDKLQWKLEKNRELLSDAPSLQEFHRLQQRIAGINELAGQQGAGLSVILSRLEQLLPDQAYLTNLVYKPADDEMLLTVEAPSAEQLTGLLQAAEKSRRFSEVLLTRQSQEKRHGQRFIQFEIRLKAKTG
jgi:hypothetical protein